MAEEKRESPNAISLFSLAAQAGVCRASRCCYESSASGSARFRRWCSPASSRAYKRAYKASLFLPRAGDTIRSPWCPLPPAATLRFPRCSLNLGRFSFPVSTPGQSADERRLVQFRGAWKSSLSPVVFHDHRKRLPQTAMCVRKSRFYRVPKQPTDVSGDLAAHAVRFLAR